MRSDYNMAPPPSAERLADGVVQSVSVVLAAAGCVVLGVLAGTRSDPLRLAALIVYGAGLLAMVGASALYACGRSGRRHMLYRHLDHAAIFLMIAGTYTPFTVISFGGVHGRLLALIWVVALVGVLLKLIVPRCAEPLSVPLYLIMSWHPASQYQRVGIRSRRPLSPRLLPSDLAAFLDHQRNMLLVFLSLQLSSGLRDSEY
jgi:hemolysin III